MEIFLRIKISHFLDYKIKLCSCRRKENNCYDISSQIAQIVQIDFANPVPSQLILFKGLVGGGGDIAILSLKYAIILDHCCTERCDICKGTVIINEKSI